MASYHAEKPVHTLEMRWKYIRNLFDESNGTITDKYFRIGPTN